MAFAVVSALCITARHNLVVATLSIVTAIKSFRAVTTATPVVIFAWHAGVGKVVAAVVVAVCHCSLAVKIRLGIVSPVFIARASAAISIVVVCGCAVTATMVRCVASHLQTVAMNAIAVCDPCHVETVFVKRLLPVAVLWGRIAYAVAAIIVVHISGVAMTATVEVWHASDLLARTMSAIVIHIGSKAWRRQNRIVLVVASSRPWRQRIVGSIARANTVVAVVDVERTAVAQFAVPQTVHAKLTTVLAMPGCAMAAAIIEIVASFLGAALAKDVVIHHNG
jgi:hypothetical protein